ncbi:hypothetical protein AAHA92_24549 [Salvia divinorum]|uniref:Uncharacterized protein n=1 Tax=Salvia divinorum TaxID=28513 RepID=A0ABD1G7S2_SALDI
MRVLSTLHLDDIGSSFHWLSLNYKNDSHFLQQLLSSTPFQICSFLWNSFSVGLRSHCLLLHSPVGKV